MDTVVKIVYSDNYRIDIGPHIFPTIKYDLARIDLIEAGVVLPADFVEPAPATWDELALAHTPDYLEKVRSGQLLPEELGRLEMAWSESMVEGFRQMAGGTLLAARLALGMPRPAAGPLAPLRAVAHLGGGFHHAFSDHGEGFCLFNDVVMTVRALLGDGSASRVAVIDLDVHQGNGTATMLGTDPAVFTLSLHQAHNYPATKPPSTLDCGLRDGIGDEEYLEVLDGALKKVFAFSPDVALYLAGADPYEDDQLGGLRVTRHGLRRRDRAVYEAARDAGVPVAILLAGGYARTVEHTVAIHVATVEEAVLLSGY